MDGLHEVKLTDDNPKGAITRSASTEQRSQCCGHIITFIKNKNPFDNYLLSGCLLFVGTIFATLATLVLVDNNTDVYQNKLFLIIPCAAIEVLSAVALISGIFVLSVTCCCKPNQIREEAKRQLIGVV